MAFDAYNYFEDICRTNKLTVAGAYRFCRVTGISYMEEMIQKFKTEKAYFCVDDTEDGRIMQMGRGSGYMERREYVVILLKKYPLNDMQAQHHALNECRNIYRQIAKKLIRDRRLLENEMTYLHTDNIPFKELAGYALSGCTGLFFSITVDIPVDLCYDGTEWDI
jgi:hypothetical protein